MSEYTPSHEEGEKFEVAPTLEDLLSLFREIAPKGFEEIKKIVDEKGLYIFEVRVPGEVEGEYAEYEYCRKDRYVEGATANAANVNGSFYKGGDDIPYTGRSVARFVNGSWDIIPFE